MGRIMVLGLAAAMLVACGEETAPAQITQPLDGVVVTRTGAFVDVPTPWSDTPRQAIELAKARWSYAPEGVSASCETGWIERSIDLALVNERSLGATFVEYEVGCGEVTARSVTDAVFVLE